MLIDWFTVCAQTLNFLILVWLMRRFLYKPILNAIDTREKLVAKELADADAKKADAQKEHDEFQQKNAEFDGQRAAMMAKATDEAKAEHDLLLDQAKKEAQDFTAKSRDALTKETNDLEESIKSRTRQEVFAITRKALKDLASTNLEVMMSEEFVRRVGEMEPQAKESLAQALKSSPDPAIVRSAFALPQEQRDAIQKAIDSTFATKADIQFETSDDVLAGIDLTSHGQRLAWNIEAYLASMERSAGDLSAKDEADGKKEPVPTA